MAKPIMPTPVLGGQAAERFIKKLETQRSIPVNPSTKTADKAALRAIVADIERSKQKFN